MRTKGPSGDRRGGIEGLPLQLMIVILIATMGTAIIMGWMGSIETPKSIGGVDVTPSEVGVSDGTLDSGVEVYVYDQDGNPLGDAVVILTGLGVMDASGGTPHGTTGPDGTVLFQGLVVERLHGQFGFLTVNVSKPGYGEDDSARLVVIP
ncbi:MAG: hypothetical protein IJ026_01585 [Candidatus Methanomethylophilaceae archaeon]|nr:hypothetical protein [Candidatus Methanomethylophilaceae archaeon]